MTDQSDYVNAALTEAHVAITRLIDLYFDNVPVAEMEREQIVETLHEGMSDELARLYRLDFDAVRQAAGQPACVHPDGYEGECPCPTGCDCCKATAVEPPNPILARTATAAARFQLAHHLGNGGNDPSLALLLNDYEAAVAAEARAEQAVEETPDRLVHVGWWCWRGNDHGHLVTQACRSDNVPIHVPTEWADDMRTVIARIEDGDEPDGATYPTEKDEAPPTRNRWRTELLDVDGWMLCGAAEEDRDAVVAKKARREENRPEVEFRLVRETTTWTVEETS